MISRKVKIIAALLIVLPILTGCSVDKIVNGALDTATGGNGAVSAAGELPKEFPSAAVPLTPGTIQFGAFVNVNDRKTWNLTVNSANVNALSAIKLQLAAVGFTASPSGDDGKGLAGATFSSATYAVTVATIPAGAGIYTVNYTVVTPPD
ncbi:MAG: hypothetical protein H7248_02345 [Microbacteriaceae bacterium]|nr:hypothetical protein [Microbacteriaceae bacterium]